jgi:hypothetical protein
LFKLPDGVNVTDLSGIAEGYDESMNDQRYTFRINVSAENIAKYFIYMISQMGQPGFFVVELPVTEHEEKELRKDKTYPFHNHVYYLDNISTAKAKEIFKKYERLFVHDGSVNFGFGAAGDEVFVDLYKVFMIFTADRVKYRKVLRNLNIPSKKHLKTVWDSFSQNSPGHLKTLSEKPSIWDMLDELKGIGFYLAETREK